MTLLEEIVDAAKRRGYEASLDGNTVVIRYPRVPALGLRVSLEGNKLVLEMLSEGLRDYIDDLRESSSDEEARELIEEVLDDIEALASSLEALARGRGVHVENRVRQGVLDALDTLEDVLES